jgi:hypothetical protein
MKAMVTDKRPRKLGRGELRRVPYDAVVMLDTDWRATVPSDGEFTVDSGGASPLLAIVARAGIGAREKNAASTPARSSAALRSSGCWLSSVRQIIPDNDSTGRVMALNHHRSRTRLAECRSVSWASSAAVLKIVSSSSACCAYQRVK